jgi:hypothetical protein
MARSLFQQESIELEVEMDSSLKYLSHAAPSLPLKLTRVILMPASNGLAPKPLSRPFAREESQAYPPELLRLMTTGVREGYVLPSAQLELFQCKAKCLIEIHHLFWPIRTEYCR